MKLDKIKLNTILYTTLIKGFAKDRNIIKALEIYQTMVDSKNSKPNNITFNTLIGCAVKCDDINTAKNLFNDMYKYNIKPDTITFSILAKGLCKTGRIVEAID
jgi:pentatricopeptide repeat protein